MSQTAKALAWQLETVVTNEASNLTSIAEMNSVERRAENTWSSKEELGHLIDSAVNNHVRFVAAPLASANQGFHGPPYPQDDWVRAHGYQQMPWSKITGQWQSHNALLVDVIQRIPEDKMSIPCRIGNGDPVTLGFLIEDYILHMQHHLDHILGRENTTSYPSAGAQQT